MNARRFEPQGFSADQPVDRMLFSPGVYPNLPTRFSGRHARQSLPVGESLFAPACWLQGSAPVDKALPRDQRP